MSATYILSVNSVERPLRVDSLDLRQAVNVADVMNCRILSEAGAYRPTLGHDVKLSENGTYIFGGKIQKAEETGADGQPIDDIETEIHCVGYADVFDRVHITETFAIGDTIEDIATLLVTDYLSDYGVTLDAGQVTGATLTEEIVADGVLLSELLDILLTNTGYAANINPDKEFILYEPGATAAAFNVVDGDANHIGDIRAIRSQAKRYNRIHVRYGEHVMRMVTDSFVGDGAEDTFELSHRIDGPVPYGDGGGAVGYAVVDYPVGPDLEPLGGLLAPSTIVWEYDPDTREITRRSGAVANGVAFNVRYDVQFPQVTSAEDAADIAANGPYELVIEAPAIYDKALAQAQAASYLNRYLSNPTEAEYSTLGLGLLVGTAQTITAADRNLSGTFLITEIHTRILGGSQDLIRTVKTIGGDEFKGSFRDVYRAWLRAGGGSVSVQASASTGVGCGWDSFWPHVAIKDGPDAKVQIRDTVGSEEWGIYTGIGGKDAALVALTKDPINMLAAAFGIEGEEDKALTIAISADGTTHIEQNGDGNAGLAISTSGDGGELDLDAEIGIRVSPGDPTLGHLSHLRGNNLIHGLQLRPQRITASTHTIDTGISEGSISSKYLYAGSADGTFTLPAVASATVSNSGSTDRSRTIYIHNASAFYLTLDGNSSETIDGRLTKLLAPGWSCWLFAYGGTGAGWFSHTSTPPIITDLTDAQIKALPSGAFALIPAPPSGWRLELINASIQTDVVAGAYTNIDGDAWSSIRTSGGTDYSSYLVNDSGAGYTFLSQLLTGADRNLSVLEPFQPIDTAGWGRISGVFGNNFPAEGFSFFVDNNGAGNFTGGHASNAMRITTQFRVEPAL